MKLVQGLKNFIWGKEKKYVVARLLFFCCLVVMFHFCFLWAKKGTFERKVFNIARPVCMFLTFWQTLNLEDGTVFERCKKLALRLLMLVGNSIGKVIDTFFNMTQATRGEGGLTQILGYEDEISRIGRTFGRKGRKPHYKRWKDMSNRERVRYLYYKGVSKHSKKNITFSYHKTAWEIYGELEQKQKLGAGDVKLFETYNDVRYQTQAEIGEEEVKACGGK